MSTTGETVRRLAKGELRSREYLDLAVAIFGSEGMERRLRYWEWLYGSNPSGDSGDELPVFCYWSGRRPVGQLGIIPVTIRWNQKRLRSGWCIDFHVLDEFQLRRGVGGKLLTAAQASFPLLMTLGQTEAARGLLLKAKWHSAGPLTVYRKFLSPVRAIAKKTVSRLNLARAVKPDLPVAGYGETSDGDRPVERRIQSNELRALQPEKNSPPAGVCRDEDFLVWRYAKCPAFSYDVQPLEAGNGQSVYVVWRFVQRDLFYSAVVQQVIYPPDLAASVLRGLLKECVATARQRGAEVLECQTSDRSILDALPRGLVTRRPGAVFLYGSQSMSDCPFQDTQEWRLYAGDCDVDFTGN